MRTCSARSVVRLWHCGRKRAPCIGSTTSSIRGRSGPPMSPASRCRAATLSQKKYRTRSSLSLAISWAEVGAGPLDQRSALEPTRNGQGGWTSAVHPPRTTASENLLSGSDHRHGLHLTCLGEYFAFVLGERFVD